MSFIHPFASTSSTVFFDRSFLGKTVALATTSLLFLAILIVGCGEKGNDAIDEPNGNAETTPASVDSLAHRLAAEYLRLSYKGASLRNTHPLRDSLEALTRGKVTGGPVTLIDTFHVAPTSVEGSDSSRTVRVEVPAALTVSRVWETSNPRVETTVTVRTNGETVSQAPRLVGWTALRNHLLRVEPDSGDAMADRLRDRWSEVTEARPGM